MTSHAAHGKHLDVLRKLFANPSSRVRLYKIYGTAHTEALGFLCELRAQ